jgi:hypothetical protein
MTYQLTSSNCVIRLADDACIPPSLDNTDYQEYLAWVAEGNEPLAAEPEVDFFIPADD